MPKRHTIKLTYFKESGKYYAEGELEVTADVKMYELFNRVRHMRDRGNLPGLGEGCGKEFTVHIDADDHPLGYPALIHKTRTIR